MDAKNNVLFDLIKSLTKTEKRFIKLNAQFHQGDKAYLKLFDAIEKQKKYDEKEILEQFKTEKFIIQFSVAKNYLQNFILKQLRNYHTESKANIICKNLLIDIEILYWKNQFKLAEKLVKKAEKIAREYQFFLTLEELSNWENRIDNAQLRLNVKHSKTISNKHENNIKNYQAILEYKALINETQLLIKESEVIRDKNELDTYKKLLNHPLIKEKSNSNSYEATYSYYVLNSVLHRLIKDQKKSGEYRAKLVDYLEQFPHINKENSIHYLSSVHNLLMHSLVVKDYKSFANYLDKVKNFKISSAREQSAVLDMLCLFELGYYNETKQYDKAIEFVNEIFETHSNIKSILNSEHYYLVHYHTALAYFNIGDYKNALVWINKVINLTSKNLRVDIKAATYVLNIITHYELSNFILLPYLVKTTLDFLKNSKMLRPIDKFFISIFSNISATSNQQQKALFFNKKLCSIKKLKLEESIISDIDYMDWLARKAT